jgi:hypothetical protein
LVGFEIDLRGGHVAGRLIGERVVLVGLGKDL